MRCPWGKVNKEFGLDGPTKEEKAYVVWKIEQPGVHAVNYCNSLGLNRRTVYHWKQRIDSKQELHDTIGRPVTLEYQDMKEIEKDVIKLRAEGKPADVDKVKSLINEKAMEVAARRNVVYRGQMDDRTGQSYMKYQDLLQVKPAQEKSLARFQSENDIMNAVSTLLMWKYIFEHVGDPRLVLNFDATQFGLTPRIEDTPKVVVSVKNEEDAHNKDRPASAPIKGKSDLMYFIKFFLIINLAGQHCSELCFVLADDRLGDDECYFYDVPELSTSSAEDAKGWVCFSKTRCPGEKFFVWFATTVLLPYIERLRKRCGHAGNMNAGVTCDGEADQIHPFLKKAMRDLMDQALTLLAKLCASSTAVSQACDAYKLFCSSKAHTKGTTVEEVQGRVTLKHHLDDMFARHAAATDDKYEKPFNQSDKRRAIIGLIKIVIALGKSLTVNTIISSWRKIGVNAHCQVDAWQVFKQFNVRPTLPEYLDFSEIDNTGKALKLWKKNGTMRDDEMLDMYEIVKRRHVNHGTPRDQLVLSRKRCVMLTHKATTARWDQIATDKAAAAAHAIQSAAIKQAEKTAKKEATEAKKVAKEEATEVKKLTKAAEELAKVQRKDAQVAERKRKVEERSSKDGRSQKARQGATYCHCNCERDSDDAFSSSMVGCASEFACPAGEWFHYACLNMADDWEPPETWFCASCARKARSSAQGSSANAK